MRDGDALGAAGGSRGEHDERRGVRVRFRHGGTGEQRLAGQRQRGAGERSRFEQLALADGQGDARVGGHGLGARARVCRVEGHTYGARRPQCELGDDRAGRAGHQQRHPVAATHPVVAQMGGERAGTGDELCVGERGVAVGDGERVRGAFGMPGHEGGQRCTGRGRRPRRGALDAAGRHGAVLPDVVGGQVEEGHVRLPSAAHRRGACRRGRPRLAGPADAAVRGRAAARRSPARWPSAAGRRRATCLRRR